MARPHELIPIGGFLQPPVSGRHSPGFACTPNAINCISVSTSDIVIDSSLLFSVPRPTRQTTELQSSSTTPPSSTRATRARPRPRSPLASASTFPLPPHPPLLLQTPVNLSSVAPCVYPHGYGLQVVRTCALVTCMAGPMHVPFRRLFHSWPISCLSYSTRTSTTCLHQPLLLYALIHHLPTISLSRSTRSSPPPHHQPLPVYPLNHHLPVTSLSRSTRSTTTSPSPAPPGLPAQPLFFFFFF